MTKFLDSTKLGYFRKSTGRVRTWNFQRYWTKSMLKFQGSIKQEVQFLGMLKKNSYGISMGLGFRPYNFQGVSHNFGEVPVVCSGISKGKMTNLKAPVFGVFFRKVYPQLLMDFFGIAQLQLKTLQGQLKPNYHGKSSSFMVPCDLPLQNIIFSYH